jgi:Uncharacterised protein family (UPF0158)
MATHEELWRIVKKLPSDFQPYGERDRDKDYGPDCSCGCVHFVKLEGELGYDWGVCANPKSPRAGLLTFEHMGCPEFQGEKDERPDTEDVASEIAPVKITAPAETGAVPLKKLRINWWDFEAALEGFEGITGEISHFLDKETGAVITLFPDLDEEEELRERIEADFGERYLCIEAPDSHVSFRFMEDFATSLADSPLKSRLLEALSRNKPFRHFKDMVHSDLALRDQWFAFQESARESYARDCLEANGIEPDWIRHTDISNP